MNAMSCFRAHQAANALLEARPHASAGSLLLDWRAVVWTTLAVVGAFGLLPRSIVVYGFQSLLIALHVAFAALRIAALAPASVRHVAKLDDSMLPKYSVLVPLLFEADVVQDLICSLSRLDYPVERHEILLIVEEHDHGTHGAAVASLERANVPHMRVIVVPAGLPRTKPRALNYALQEAVGDIVTVFDAEDDPDKDQLRRAAAALAAGGPLLGCVQACLNTYNANESWLTQQFTIEYSSLFDRILPVLERYELVVPLGGTSNHFPRHVLDAVGGWDAYNVTEDADLGVRLARAGYRVAVLHSTTHEEAPDRLGLWMAQRTRWLKGWLQTWLVHMRSPRRLWKELGPKRFLSFQLVLGGALLSALAHPWFYVVTLWDLAVLHMTFSKFTLLMIAAPLAVGYGTTVVLGAVAVARRRRASLAVYALLQPAYWLLISAAAYLAVVDLIRHPFLWAKTAHRPRHTGAGLV